MSVIVSPQQPRLQSPDRAAEKLPEQASTVDSKNVTKRARKPLVRATLMLIRRSHLYFGLLLVPWALLYGITAYLFNHPTHFSGNQVRSVYSKKTLGPLFGADRDESAKNAQLVCDELQRRFGDESKKIELAASPEPKWDGNLISTSFDWNESSYSVLLPIQGHSANVRITEKRKPQSVGEKAFFEVEVAGGASRGRGRHSGPTNLGANSESESRSGAPVGVEDKLSPGRSPLRLDEQLTNKIQSHVAELALQLDPAMTIEPQSVKVNSVPELVFQVNSDDKQWECRHNPVVGSVAVKPVGSKADSADLNWRRFLLRLHTAHTYPSGGGVRWYWAVIVDIMAFVMVFWGISGIVMWWQIKSTRRFGTVAMLVSLITATWLFVAMFRVMHG